ncbi:ComEA family DNA-binding protein [Streptomyces sp. NPDC026672]|uniref:ComEA family DNA-binding protein n=1 Tax=unclassified Streptomyces TaxID=2593676 RepID=UPI0033C89144
MALRSRSRTTTATSGPGRAPASDSRTRHRRQPIRRTSRHGHAPVDDLRRRAELLFGEPGPERQESGHGPPGGSGSGGVGAGAVAVAGDAPLGVGHASPDVGHVPPGGRDLPGDDRPPGLRERVGTALRERMPVWVQARCGMERRGVIALAALLALVAVFAVQHFWAGRPQTVRAPQVVRAEQRVGEKEGREPGEAPSTGPAGAASAAMGTAGAAGAATEIVVDVGGKVHRPGIQRLPAGSRVVDALRAAGGVRRGVSTDGLNRARFLVDGEQIVVGAPAPPGGAGAGGGGPAGSGAAVAGAGPVVPISLNTATVDQLDTLPGVGPVLAQHIVDYRAQHGGYRSVDELRQVKGIGDRRFADLRDLVRP